MKSENKNKNRNNNETPCDDCAIFDRLMYPALMCKGCIESGRYAERQKQQERWKRESA